MKIINAKMEKQLNLKYQIEDLEQEKWIIKSMIPKFTAFTALAGFCCSSWIITRGVSQGTLDISTFLNFTGGSTALFALSGFAISSYDYYKTDKEIKRLKKQLELTKE